MDYISTITVILHLVCCFLWIQVQGTVVGKFCTNDEDCYYQPSQFAVCLLGQCACVMRMSYGGPMCGPSIGTVVGKPCSRDQDCHYPQKHVVICMFGQCRCALGMHDWKPICRKSIVSGYGEYCLFEEDCNHADPSMICKYRLLSGECACKSGYHCCGDHGQCIPDTPQQSRGSLASWLVEYVPMLALIAVMVIVGCATYTWKYVRLNRMRNMNSTPSGGIENGRPLRPPRRRGQHKRLAQMYGNLASRHASQSSMEPSPTTVVLESAALSSYHSLPPLHPPPSYEEALKYKALQSNYFASEANVSAPHYHLASGNTAEEVLGECAGDLKEEEPRKTARAAWSDSSMEICATAADGNTRVELLSPDTGEPRELNNVAAREESRVLNSIEPFETVTGTTNVLLPVEPISVNSIELAESSASEARVTSVAKERN